MGLVPEFTWMNVATSIFDVVVYVSVVVVLSRLLKLIHIIELNQHRCVPCSKCYASLSKMFSGTMYCRNTPSASSAWK
jgi:hypothetical protein